LVRVCLAIFQERKAEGILDPLLIKGLTLTCNGTTVVVLAIDLISVDYSLVDKMRASIQHNTGISPKRVFIHATHTHTGARVSEIEDRLPEQTVSAVLKALENRQHETHVKLGYAEEKSVTFIRRYLMKDGTVRTNPGRANPNIVRPIGQIDARANVLSFNDTKILLVSHGLHCDCVSGSKFPADYPYHLTEGIRGELGSDWNVVYLNACSGNINHINVNDKDQRSSYQQSRKIGRTLAESCNRASHRQYLRRR
jgi:neutral ceramidase